MVTAFLPSISVDDCSLALCTPAGTEHRLYFSSSKKASEGTLYSCSRAKGWAILPWTREKYILNAAHSHLANVICRIRDWVGVLFNELPILFSCADHWSQHLCNHSIRVFVLISALTNVGWVGTAMMIAEITSIRWVFRALRTADWSGYYPLAASTIIGGFALGAAVWMPTVYCIAVMEKGIQVLMGSATLPVTEEQDAVKYLKDPDSAVAMGLYACIGAPIIEEFVFRGLIRDLFKSYESSIEKGRITRTYTKLKEFVYGKAPAISRQRASTVLKTSILFGLMHCSTAQGLANVPIAFVTGSLGLVMGILRETTGNLWAPMALHSMHNTMTLLRMWGIVSPLPFLD